MNVKMERECQLITDGYTKDVSSKYDLMIPPEIFSIIFMFYYMELFYIEYGDQMKSSIIENMGADKQDIWTAKQVYIALSNALSACAMLKIDAAPMEGFDPDAYNKILGLTEKGLKATVILGIGYRSEKDDSQFLPKVRKPLETLFETI